MKNITLLSICFLLLFACKPKVEPTEDNEYKYFGEVFDASSPGSFESLIEAYSSTDTIETTISGKVDAVCQAKGCWMNIVSEDGTASEEVFVKFKDYGFFMPMDIAGQTVIMTGKAFKEVTSVEDLKHYAEDEGKSEEEIAGITEPVEELKFLASGVAMKK